MDENSDVSLVGHDGDPLGQQTAGLAAAALELARETEGEPVPRPRLFALVGTASLLASQPAFGALLPEATIEQVGSDPHHLTPVELDAPGVTADPLAAIAEVRWPDIASGGALVTDLDAARWAERAPGEAASISGTGTLRVIVAARDDGCTWCAVRSPGTDGYALGPRLVPDLAAALAESLRDGSDIED